MSHTAHRRALPPITVCLALAALAVPAPARTPDRFAELVDAERTFAADAQRIGITPAFRRHAAPEGVLLRPDPVPAQQALAGDSDSPGVTLEWGPETAALARSGDLGFTTGPYRLRAREKVLKGRFLTIWRRGADGRWGWLLDHGLPPQPGTVDPQPAIVTRLAPGRAPKRGAETRVATANDTLDAAWAAQGGGAIAALLAPGAQVLRDPQGNLAGAAATTALVAEPAPHSTGRLGLFVSRAGDLAASYGAVTGAGRRGHYVRVWRAGPKGWRLLIDELVWLPKR